MLKTHKDNDMYTLTLTKDKRILSQNVEYTVDCQMLLTNSITAHVTSSLSVPQLKEQVVDLEKERDLLKENCDKLVTRWEII